jgi:multiple sugar transport system permease protein
MKQKSLKSRIPIILFLTLSLVLTMFPFYWMIVTSITPESILVTTGPSFRLQQFSLENYRHLLSMLSVTTYYTNSLIVALGTCVFSIFLNTTMAYAFSKLNFPAKDKIFTCLIITLLIPAQVTMIPVFFMLKQFGLLNSFFGLILPASASAFSVFMVRQFINELPDELIEAARIDGYSEWMIFWRIIFPLCKPIVASLGIMTFIASWNDFIWPLIVMRKKMSYTLPVALANLNGEYGNDWGLLMAGSVVVVVPVIIAFLIMQKYYIQGLSAGALKG